MDLKLHVVIEAAQDSIAQGQFVYLLLNLTCIFVEGLELFEFFSQLFA